MDISPSKNDTKPNPKDIVSEVRSGNKQNLKIEGAISIITTNFGVEEGKPKPRRVQLVPCNEFACNSSEAIHLKLVRSEADLDDDDTTFHPQFTHQIFGKDEEIVGYKGLRIDIYYVASTLYTYINWKCDKKMLTDDSKDPIQILTQEKIQFRDAEYYPISHEYTRQLDEFKKHIDDKFVPFGDQIECYTHNDKTFEIYRVNIKNPDAKEYHERLQTFALFFIENASYINAEDEKWELFLIFEKYKTETNNIKYSIVGYTTVYPFFAYPDSTRLRVSQFLILPQFHRQGHGTKLLKAVYEYAKQIKSLEVCIEDPSDEFQTMRDAVDIRLFTKLMNDKDARSKLGIQNPDDLQWSDELWKKVRDLLKINKNQIRKCYEIYKLERAKLSNEPNAKDKYTKCRLEIKRRLYRECDLEAIQDPIERKSKLDEIYQELEQEYVALFTKSS